MLLPSSLLLIIWRGFVFFVITDKKEVDGAPHVVVMPTPSKRGRKKKATTLARVGPVGGPGHETLILAHLTAGGQVPMNTSSRLNQSLLQVPSAACPHRFLIDVFTQVAALHQGRDPYDLSHEGEGPKDTTKTYRYSVCSHPHSTQPPRRPPPPPPPAAECKRICFCASCWNQRRDVVLFNVSRALLDISIWHMQTSLHTLNCMLWHSRLLLLVVYKHLSSNSFQTQIVLLG